MTAWRCPRRNAWLVKAMLALWMFSLGAGWANACLLQAGPASPGHAQARAWPTGADAHATIPHTAQPHDDTPAGLDACVTFCANEHGAIPKLKLPLLADLEATLPLLAATWVPRVADHDRSRGRTLATPPPPGSPVAIRFLRLTL